MAAAIENLLFDPRAGLRTYAVLDGASVPQLPAKLQAAPEYECLFGWDIDPILAAASPYLVRLIPGDDFTKWLLQEGWGKNWCIFALSKAQFHEVSGHFRRCLLVQDPDGKQLYFRYYDPRVMRIFLPTCNDTEVPQIFGPVQRYLMEDGKGQPVIFRDRQAQ